MTTQSTNTNPTPSNERVLDQALFAELFPPPVVQGLADFYAHASDDRQPASASTPPITIPAALQQTIFTGAALVEHSTIGGYLGIVNGQLLCKLQLRLPIKKIALFLVSLLTLTGLLAPYLGHVQVLWH